MEIPVGITGRILDGEYAGWEIEVMYDAEGTGGYYVFLTHGEEGYDDWVEDSDSVRGYFEEANWPIDWGRGDSLRHR
ncbi:hypothetical protein [Actinomyces ruminicola]|uniref:Uncharacterized protein n=1 Tax=Actinomyces ruminicola TaxID=332524 RepID=A0A1G9WT55_9ACTO|nr:hypothetical protein [Actinomyces ruminicola]SDM87670.1 hypothetical protein SAMN04487766_10837 [Actinomyces ruminicola]